MHGSSGSWPAVMRLLARRLLAVVAASALAGAVAGCGTLGSPSPTSLALPSPTCGGAKILIPGAVPCEQLVRLGLEVLQREAPGQLDRGVIAVTVDLEACPKNAIPRQLDCSGEDFVQLVTFTFGPSGEGGPIEPSLSVGVGPVSGRILGIVNPLIR
jgi:hypothetical protein